MAMWLGPDVGKPRLFGCAFSSSQHLAGQQKCHKYHYQDDDVYTCWSMEHTAVGVLVLFVAAVQQGKTSDLTDPLATYCVLIDSCGLGQGEVSNCSLVNLLLVLAGLGTGIRVNYPFFLFASFPPCVRGRPHKMQKRGGGPKMS